MWEMLSTTKHSISILLFPSQETIGTFTTSFTSNLALTLPNGLIPNLSSLLTLKPNLLTASAVTKDLWLPESYKILTLSPLTLAEAVCRATSPPEPVLPTQDDAVGFRVGAAGGTGWAGALGSTQGRIHTGACGA